MRLREAPGTSLAAGTILLLAVIGLGSLLSDMGFLLRGTRDYQRQAGGLHIFGIDAPDDITNSGITDSSLRTPDAEELEEQAIKDDNDKMSMIRGLADTQIRLLQAWEAGQFALQKDLGLPAGMLDRMAADAVAHSGSSSISKLKQVFLKAQYADVLDFARGNGSERPRGIHVAALGGSITRGYSTKSTLVDHAWPDFLLPFLEAAFPRLQHRVTNSAFNINVGEAWDSELLLEQLKNWPTQPALLNVNFFGCKSHFTETGAARGGLGCDPWPTPAASEFTGLATAGNATTLSLATALRSMWRPRSQPACNATTWEALTGGACEAECTSAAPGMCPSDAADFPYSTSCTNCLKACYERWAGSSPTQNLTTCKSMGGAGAEISADTVVSTDAIHSTQFGHRLAAAVITRHLLSVLFQLTTNDVNRFWEDSREGQHSPAAAAAAREGLMGSSGAKKGEPAAAGVGECFTTVWGSEYRKGLHCKALEANVSGAGWSMQYWAKKRDKQLFMSKTGGSTITFRPPSFSSGWVAVLYLRSKRLGPALVSLQGSSNPIVVNDEKWDSETNVVGGCILPEPIEAGHLVVNVTVMKQKDMPVGFAIIGLFLMPTLEAPQLTSIRNISIAHN
eukprot:jgi/Mesen1/5891/ME000003S06922